MRLDGKVAVVTGAGSGFGEGMARLFAAEGAAVIAADINGDGAARVAAEIAESGGKAIASTSDVTSRPDVQAMIAAATETYGGLDILVNNAGFAHRNKSISEVGEEEFDRIFDVNIKAIYIAVQEVLPIFKRQGSGVILNTSSTAALRPRPGLSVYNASKGAANVMTKSLAVELAPDNIRVNAVCPVIGETGLLETFMGVPDTPENRAKFIATIPMGRMSTPADIAGAALYLVSDEAEFITGVTMEVDGGRCI